MGLVLAFLGFDLEKAAVGGRARGHNAIDTHAVLETVARGDVGACAHDDPVAHGGAGIAGSDAGCGRERKHLRPHTVTTS